ncbi:hypothetical protein C1646_687221 [Rhizophagus diaphanus]|nr:hypothetical protein C1646_687221 [Rhizophagus diaphanus] [Rhizophagus sp. MUCL 43196]
MDITLKKILVVNYIEDEKFEFILGYDFIRDFDVEIEENEDIHDKQLLHRLKFTVQLNEIGEINEFDEPDYTYDNFDDEAISTISSISAGSSNIRNKRDDFAAYASDDNDTEPNRDTNYDVNSSTSASENSEAKKETTKEFQDNARIQNNSCTKYYYMIAAFMLFCGLISMSDEHCNYKHQSKEHHLIFKDKIDWLEKEIASIQLIRININGSCLNVLESSPLNYLVQISDKVNQISTSYKFLLKHYGTNLWIQRERYIKDLKTIVEPPSSIWSLIFFINQREQRENKINELFLSNSKNDKNKIIFSSRMEVIYVESINMIDYIKKVQSSKKVSGDKTLNCLNHLMTELQCIKFNINELRAKNIIINHIFMKLKDDIIRILEKRDFNDDEIEIINHLLEYEQINRNLFLKLY